LTGHIDIVAKI